MLQDDLFIKLISSNNRPYTLSKNKPILKILKQKYPQFKYSEFFYLLKNKNNLETIHIFCPICGKKNSFIDNTRGYLKHCSSKCAINDPITRKQMEDTCFKNHGVTHNWKSKDPKLNGQARRQELYNDPHYHNIEKAKDTLLNSIDKDGLNGYQRIAKKMRKIRKKINPKTGLNSFQSGALKAKITKLNKIDENGMNGFERAYEHGKQTLIRTRGVDNYSKTDEFKNRIKQIMRQKYHVDNYTQTQEYKDLYKNEGFVNKRSQKIYETMIRNNSFNQRSKPEKRCFALLQTKFPDAVHTYRDKVRYPFKCDMFIPSKDLFIECHFGQFHYTKPFNPNNKQHLIRLENLKKKEFCKLNKGAKNTKYTGMINTWTISDPLKLETFKKNKLNYKIFYTEKEFLEWFNKQ